VPASNTKGGNPVIPDETKAKFPLLIELILGSESMNDEERQYWINILPVMTPDQIASLKDILETERRQLSAIDQKYAKEIKEIGNRKIIEKTGEERRQKRASRTQKESSAKEEDTEKANQLLREIEDK